MELGLGGGVSAKHRCQGSVKDEERHDAGSGVAAPRCLVTIRQGPNQREWTPSAAGGFETRTKQLTDWWWR